MKPEKGRKKIALPDGQGDMAIISTLFSADRTPTPLILSRVEG
jgi:hypothetical protein